MQRVLNYIVIVLLFAVVAVSLNNIFVESQKASVNVYFVYLNKQNNEVIVPLSRKVYKENLFENTINALLDGPSAGESAKGYSTEIPPETKLIEVKELDDKVVLNLSEDFEYGGGTGSMLIRFNQLTSTIDDVTDKPVYFEIEGKQVEAIGGEGIFINQPINRKPEPDTETESEADAE